MKILITGGKTATALKITKAFEDTEIILADYGAMPAIKSTAYSLESIGEWNQEILAHHLLTKCLDYGVDKLLPLYESEIVAIAKSLTLFDEFGIQVLVPENPSINQRKSKDWCLFENGKLIYTSAKFDFENADSIHLNGAYFFDVEKGKLELVSIPNPL